jgi:hypothetical protein
MGCAARARWIRHVKAWGWLAGVLLMFGASTGRAGAQEAQPPDGGVEPLPTETPDGGIEPEPAEATDARPQVVAPGTSLFEAPVAAAPATASVERDQSAPAVSAVELGGYVRGDLFVGKVPGFDQGVVQAAYGEVALAIDGRDEGIGSAHAEARLRSGLQGEARELVLDLREAYVDAYVGPLDLRFGHQIIVWGRADGINPTNNLSPFDLRIRSPIEDDRRVGNLGVRAFYNLRPVRIEGVWLPLYRAAHYPPIALDEYIVMTEPNFPAPELEKGLGAARVHLELPVFEASVSYVRGYAPLPGIALRDFTVGENPPEVRVARTAYAQHVVGFDASTALGDVVTLRAEAAYRHPDHYEDHVHAARPDVQYVIGADRSFGPLSVIAQYIGRYVLDWALEDGPDEPIEPETLARFSEPLPRSLRASITQSIEDELAMRNQVLFQQTARVQHMASLRLEWLALHDTLSLSALGFVNFTTREWLVFPKVGYRMSDAMTTYVGAEVYVGPTHTLLDLIDEQLTAGYAELRYAF